MVKLPKENLLKFPSAIYFVTIFLLVLLALVYLIFEFHRRLTISAKKDFIGTVSANLISADQSMDELRNSLVISSNNYQTFVKNEDNFQRVNFSEVLKSNETNLSQLDTVRNSLLFQKDLIKDTKVPKDYIGLQVDFLTYYDKSSGILEDIRSDFDVENQIYEILNSNLGNINIYNDDLWQNGQTEEIVIFYQNLKDASSRALVTMQSLKVPKKYEDYYSLHVSYLAELVSSAAEVVNSLSVDDQDLSNSQPDKLEIAFKKVNDSQNKLDKILDEIKEEREGHFSQSASESNFDNLSAAQQKLENQIKNYYQHLFKEARQNLIEF